MCIDLVSYKELYYISMLSYSQYPYVLKERNSLEYFCRPISNKPENQITYFSNGETSVPKSKKVSSVLSLWFYQ